MKPVFQTIIKNPGGNGYQAALASILEIDLADVPFFPDLMFTGGWVEAVGKYNEWLGVFGLRTVTMQLAWDGLETLDECKTLIRTWSPGYHILGVSSPGYPDSKNGHAVVALNGEIVHDPNPTYDPHCEFYRARANWRDFDMLLAIDPGRNVRIAREANEAR